MGLRSRLKRVLRGLRRTEPTEPAPRVRATAPSPEPAASRCAPGDLWAARDAITPDGKPRLVNHWATWCEGCIEEMDALLMVYERWKDHVDFRGISWDVFQFHGSLAAAVEAVDAFVGEQDLPWPNLVFDGDPDELFEGLELTDRQIPQTTLYDARGAVVFHHVGVVEGEAAEALQRALEGTA